MFKSRKWTKIYLFYGGIFFLLGLTGYLANHEAKIERWSAENLSKFNNYLSGLFQAGGPIKETPVMVERQHQIVFLNYSTGRNNSLNKFLQNRLQSILQTYYRSIIPISIDNLTNLDQVYGDLKLQSTPWILVGYNRVKKMDSKTSPELQSQLFLSLPEESLKSISTQIFQSIIENFSSLTITKQVRKNLEIIEFSWNDYNDSNYSEQELVKSLLTIINAEISKMTPNKAF